MPAILAGSLALVLLAASPATASALYQSTVLVTGMDTRSRPGGLLQALRLVLTKVSGNPEWLDDDRVASVPTLPLLAGFAYLDRQSDLPKHDEQGTRDRPYFLIARFDAAGIDALLRRWGDRPWDADRPVVVVQVAITTRAGDTMYMRADTDADERHRGALLAAADRFGLELFVPAVAVPVPAPPSGPTLSGILAWNEPDAGWNGSWQVEWQGRKRSWEARGQSFDEAYRTALAGTDRFLSGH